MELAWGGLEICRVQERPTLKSIAHDCDPEDHKSILKTWPEHQLLYTFFPWWVFSHWVFSCKVFNEATSVHKQCMWCTLFSYFFPLVEVHVRHTRDIKNKKY
jgi:hypothetical protein